MKSEASEPKRSGLFHRYPSLTRLAVWRRRRKVPYVQQLSATECGPACLAMVLGYFGSDVGMEKLRDACGVGREGTNASALLTAARLLGLLGRAVKADMDQLELLPPGATILHWQFHHFVVLSEVHSDWIEIVDPAVGRRRVSIEQFRKDFTGVALIFEPGELFKRHRGDSVLLKTIKTLIVESGLIPRLVVMSSILQLLGLALPFLVGQLIDRVIPRADIDFLYTLLAGMTVVVGFQALGNLVRGNLLLHLRTVLDVKMGVGFLDHLVKLPYPYFQARSGGDLMMRLNSNGIVREHLTSAVMSGLLDTIFVVVYFVVMLVGSWPMALAATVVAALNVAIYLAVRRPQRELMTMGLDAQASSRAYEIEMLTAMESLKATGSEEQAVAHWCDLFVNSTNVSLRRERLTMNAGIVAGVVGAVGPMAILLVGAAQALKGDLSLGALLSLFAVSRNFLTPVGSLVDTFLSLEIVRGYLVRVADVIDAQPEQDPFRVRIAPTLTGALTLEHVSFRYSPQGPVIINDVSLNVRPGQFIAIAGRSGSGKSTLANLLIGLYKPESGRVLIDGTDLKELELRSVRRQIGVVNQNLSLFGRSIRDNIALSDASLPLHRVVRAARLASIHDDIVAMPTGYSTRLGDNGGSISVGQKQRLALARALVREPAVLLLDEATSALDALTEAEIQRSLEELRCTRIVVAHRLSTIRNADLILVLDHGTIKESGTHEELIRQDGFYASLLSSQMAVVDRSPVSSLSAG